MESNQVNDLVRFYFMQGYSYRLILCFLFELHEINFSLRTLKTILKELGLRGRSGSQPEAHIRMCIEVRQK